MVQNLESIDFTAVPFGYGFKDMSPPTKKLMKLVLEGKLAHGGHTMLRWIMDNIFIRSDPAGNIKADKERSTEKMVTLPLLWALTGRSAVAAIQALRFMTAGTFRLYNPKIFFLNNAILLMELSLT